MRTQLACKHGNTASLFHIPQQHTLAYDQMQIENKYCENLLNITTCTNLVVKVADGFHRNSRLCACVYVCVWAYVCVCVYVCVHVWVRERERACACSRARTLVG
jgi:hypothetical protein